MLVNKPRLFGINHSNRDFTQKDTWGKNQFNSSFPAALSAYIHSINHKNIYLKLNQNLEVVHNQISTIELFGLSPQSDDLFYAFESAYSPYQQLLVGYLPRVDLVTQSRNSGHVLKPLEIKLTALPDHTTCELEESKYGCELVVRPDTIVYLACSIAHCFKGSRNELKKYFSKDFANIANWNIGQVITPYLSKIVVILDKIMLSLLGKQEPLLMQPIWKTKGKSPILADNCLDVFVWSNLAFSQLFLDIVRRSLIREIHKINRPIRTMIWLFKMLHDFAEKGQFNHAEVIDNLSYNTKNDKAFAVSGKTTHPYMSCTELTKPRIRKEDIQEIILGGGQELLSPERRFDAIIYNSPKLFE
ncbi:MAG: HindVP family restriction endonuclease [Chitinophagales bacterium]